MEQLLFKDGEPRWERLQSLLEEAGTTSDYDVTAAVDQLVDYLVSDKARSIRELLVVQAIDVLDEIGTDASEFGMAFAALSFSPRGATAIAEELRGILQQQEQQKDADHERRSTATALSSTTRRKPTSSSSSQSPDSSLTRLITSLVKAATPTAQAANPSPALIEAYRTLQLLSSSSGGGGLESATKAVAIVQKVLRDPVSQDALARVGSALGERAAARLVRRFLGEQPKVSNLRKER